MSAEETRFKKGQKGGPGRPKGLPNSVNADVKAMILQALHNAGGAEYLTECANTEKTKTAFLSLIGRVLPMQVTGADGGAVKQHIRVTFE